jgi:hypothetical protein
MAEFVQGTKPKGVCSLKKTFFTFCELGTFIMNFIDDLGVSIVFLYNGDARLGYGLLKYEIFRRKSQGVHLESKKNVNTNKYAVFRQPA